MSSYFFLEAEKNAKNAVLIDKLKNFSESNQTLIYVLDKPLTDQKYSYKYSDALILLSSRRKIAIINYGSEEDQYEDFVEDVIEDIGSIADKYQYKEVVGRPRVWRKSLLETEISIDDITDINIFFDHLVVIDETDNKKLDLLISLFIGSINDIDRVKDTIPSTLLDKVKQKIQLFDGDQTRFIYQNPDKKKIRIQGLSGTGKTELLLHKLKDLYINDIDSKIFFTCHNKILADDLRKRIPDFFNFMKVEQQIEWNSRLWCTNAWGSSSNSNSGAYRYICAFYNIPFYRFSYQMSFSKACQLAIDDIKEKYNDNLPFALTYMFIDESQDFDDTFFELCDLVTEKNVYIAGDIFQSIFEENISSTIEPDFLLGKCYRTDPKTLMFAHGLGMGLFEETKLRWLEEKEWKDCGYNVAIKNSKYHLSREPLKRFEDLDEDFESIKIVEIQKNFSDTVIETINEIRLQNETVKPEDIGIILLDSTRDIYRFADIVEVKIQKKFGWNVNKAYESKENKPDTLLISNRNNVKGLEFPFVICVTKKITDSPSYRNSLYTMLTRSFIKSFFVTQPRTMSGLTEDMYKGLKHIVLKKEMVIQEPSDEEKEIIQTRFKYSLKKLSHYDLMMEIFKELKVDKDYQETLLQATQQMDMIESDQSILKAFVRDNLKYLKGK
ncbi:superfamily I DNA and RNA helicase [Catalinimonas alkaloidigena]|uniref:DEAD/DEAH box helicase n=1 Tax=Catalinimonas alkaloidigena TaxID=1075417 RepID=UPI0024060BB0|nr:ATP-binding domain-containing protein [Catalinimonas alkaloidigena]MDF9799769.1 superfamily I DNA and RNA helicase [Catalinimonas alkaloidigena]